MLVASLVNSQDSNSKIETDKKIKIYLCVFINHRQRFSNWMELDKMDEKVAHRADRQSFRRCVCEALYTDGHHTQMAIIRNTGTANNAFTPSRFEVSRVINSMTPRHSTTFSPDEQPDQTLFGVSLENFQ